MTLPGFSSTGHAVLLGNRSFFGQETNSILERFGNSLATAQQNYRQFAIVVVRPRPGYRIYYAMSGKTVVLLLVGGDKSTQQKDIETAKTYWNRQKEEE